MEIPIPERTDYDRFRMWQVTLAAITGTNFLVPYLLNVDFVVRNRYLMQGKVITSHSKLRGVITYPCLRYLLLATKSSNQVTATHLKIGEPIFIWVAETWR